MKTSHVNPYQQPVKELSDEELKVLSAELEEAFCRSGLDDYYWIDDDAEERYYQLTAEIQRRWRLAHPEWRPPQPGSLISATLESIRHGLALARNVNAEFDREFSKCGDATSFRRPPRFVASRP